MPDPASPTPPRFDMTMTAVFPCYNEEGNIERLVEQAIEVFPSLLRDWQVVIVNDGSQDRTREIADRLAAGHPQIHAVHHPTNQGYGGALRSGFAAATMDYLFFTDGDGQFDLHELDRLLALAGPGVFVNGYRIKRQEGFRRHLNSVLWASLVRTMLGFRTRDVDCAFKLFPRAMLGQFPLKSSGAMIDAELLARASRAGYPILDVGVSHLPRKTGHPTGAKLRVILKAFRELRKLRRDIRSTHPAP